MSLESVLDKVASYHTKLVEVTGGEPLEHEDVYPLMHALLDRDYAVMLETGGHVSISRVPESVIKIIDIKTPDSKEADTFCWDNIPLAQPHDEFKFVICSRADYEWSRNVMRERFAGLSNPILFSPSHDELSAQDLARWILEDDLRVRLQLQIHKYIWGATTRGV